MICFGIWNSIQDTYIYLPRAQSNRLSLRRRRDDLLWHMEFNPRLLLLFLFFHFCFLLLLGTTTGRLFDIKH
ncbi:hypothetical protein Syun_008956 [Stephania yunnanensis]|uniref:Uncharacterized protein n=1 Tax=Stephania yunnanensis TaxID=152371 RepID=A0AAP0KG38_9MAGN